MKREWAAAIAKRDAEPGCRVCGAHPVEAAHVIGRARDKRVNGVAVVNPDSVVGLCAQHHRAYDERRLDLNGYLSVEEQAQAVLDAGGIWAALRRITPRDAA